MTTTVSIRCDWCQFEVDEEQTTEWFEFTPNNLADEVIDVCDDCYRSLRSFAGILQSRAHPDQLDLWAA